MEKIIYKYDIEHGENTLELPEGSKLLHVGEQGEQGLQVWVLRTSKEAQELFKIFVCWTGQTLVGLDDNAEHIGTVQASNGLVYHCFHIK